MVVEYHTQNRQLEQELNLTKREKDEMMSQITSMKNEMNTSSQKTQMGQAIMQQNGRQVKQINLQKHPCQQRPNDLPRQIDIDALFANSMKASKDAATILFDDGPAKIIGATESVENQQEHQIFKAKDNEGQEKKQDNDAQKESEDEA